MPNSDSFARLHRALLLLPVVIASGCAGYSPERLAYRDRLESGFLTPEDQQRFRTPDALRLARSADANESMLLRSEPADAALFRAAANDDLTAMKLVLEQPGVFPNAIDSQGNTPLSLAARNGNADMLRLLLKAGADVNGRGGAMPPLAVAALHGQLRAMAVLLAFQADIDLAGANGLSPLWCAVQLNQTAAAELLITHGARYRALNQNGDSMLVQAVRDNQLAMLDTLLRNGVPADLRDSEGHSALYWAQHLHRDSLGTLLVAHGASVDQLVVELRPAHDYNNAQE